MRIQDLISTSSESLTRSKSRSILTVLGIVIGIAAVIMMLSIGQSAQGLILSEVADLGSDLIFVEPSSGDPMNGPPDPFIEQTINLDDVEVMRESGLFAFASGMLVSSVLVSHGEESIFAQLAGIGEGYLEIFPAELASGRFIDKSDVESKARITVLGKEIAEDLFGQSDAVGKKIKMKKISFRVVGVLEEQGTRFFQNLDQRILVPVTTAQRDILGVDHVSYISARAIGDIDYVKEETRYLLRDSHNIDNPEGDPEKDDFFVSSQSDAVEMVGIVGGILTLLLSSIAAISLVVGGIGIMNIMLVSVTERTREIGLRKAVGATYREILKQFLLESVMLTLVGGIMGVLIGILFSFGSALIVASFVDGWRFVLPPEAIFMGVVVATTVGIVFGLYPARRAARLDPIEALRYE
ncbi:MAG: ABC transporter permease [Patescibacteria group bacterium]